jgi:hypothetical protein
MSAAPAPAMRPAKQRDISQIHKANRPPTPEGSLPTLASFFVWNAVLGFDSSTNTLAR